LKPSQPNCFLGVEIGGTKTQLVVTDESLIPVEKYAYEVGKSKEASQIRQLLSEKIPGLISSHPIQSVGIGFGGPVNPATGCIHRSFHVSGWDDFNLQQWMIDLTDLPVFVDNDCNVAALSEAVHGAGQPYSRVFYITLGSGVGGGFVVNGKIYYGKGPSELEVGHLVLNKKRATLESSCSGWALNGKLIDYIKRAPKSKLAKLVVETKEEETKCMLTAMKAGDHGVAEIWDSTMDDLALGLSHVIHLLNPDVIVVGGGLSLIGNDLVEDIKKKLPKYLMSTLKNKLPKVKLSELKEMSVPYGAILLARSKLLMLNQTDY
jgi:glucokinase